MDRSSLKKSAAAAVSLALIGCASAPSGKDATVLSGLFGKQPAPSDAGKNAAPKDKAPAAPGAIPVPTDLDGAVRQAEEQRKAGDLTGAARTLSQLVLVAPDNPRVLGEYGKTLLAQGRSDDALAFLARAIELKPGDWSLFSAQGIAYDQKGEYEAAQAAYGRALALNPGDPAVLSNNALSHVQSGDLDGAEQFLLQAQQAGAANPRIASNLALVRSLKASRLHPVPAEAIVATPVPAGTATAAPPPAPAEDRPVASIPLPAPANSLPLLPAIAPASPVGIAKAAEPRKDDAPEPARIEQPIEPAKPGPAPLMQPGPKTIAPPPSLRRERADVSQSLASRPALSSSER
jgi:Flp pilus assembly protein TadD